MNKTVHIFSSPQTDTPAEPGRRARLHRWAFRSLPTESRTFEFIRIVIRILLIMGDEFKKTHLTIRASSLTYLILLSLVPILALSTSILKGLGSDEQLKQAAIRLIDQLEHPSLHVQQSMPRSADDITVPDPAVSETDPVPITAHLHRAVDIVFKYVDRTNFAALGAFGVLGLIIGILFVLASIEEAMNVIWHTHAGRPLSRKVMDYLALLILLPLSLNIALAAEAVLANQSLMNKLNVLLPSALMFTISIKMAPFVFITLTLTTMYLFFPHTKVKASAAFTGACFAAVFWFTFQKLYIFLQIGLANYNAIYGSFASIPLFLIWLHIGWTCILLGASLAYALQHHRYYHFSEAVLSPQRQLQIAIDILEIIYDQFSRRTPTSLSYLKKELPQIRQIDIQQTVTRLLHGGLLMHIQNKEEKGSFVPATPVNAFTVSEVVNLIFGSDTSYDSTGGLLAQEAVHAAAQAVNFPFGKKEETR
ncbi:MAG: YihY/virulence factor BrkB family protein [Desulfobulbus sp.]|nr:YihY/virulence factor BrkB family protein [Desulfobulbus sp.]